MSVADHSQQELHLNQFLDAHEGLKRFYKGNRLGDVVSRAKETAKRLIDNGCSPEFALSLSVLTLYDIVILIDDSSSMNLEENGERKKTLERTLHEITKVYDLVNPTDGLMSVRFLNARKAENNIKNSDVPGLFKYRVYNGGTMIGTELKRKVLDRFVFMEKPMLNPLLVMTITDGVIDGEREGLLEHVIKECMDNLAKDPDRGQADVVFHFSQVGNDVGAKKMLKHLDTCEEVGKYVDFLEVDLPLENLADPDLKWGIVQTPQSKGIEVELTGILSLQLTKLLLGATDELWDKARVNSGRGSPDPDYKNHDLESKFEDFE